MQAWMDANREVEAATTLVIAAARRLTDAEAAQAIAIKAVCAADWMPNLQAAAAAFVPDGPEEPGAIEATLPTRDTSAGYDDEALEGAGF
jgi:hypothetical protein